MADGLSESAVLVPSIAAAHTPVQPAVSLPLTELIEEKLTPSAPKRRLSHHHRRPHKGIVKTLFGAARQQLHCESKDRVNISGTPAVKWIISSVYVKAIHMAQLEDATCLCMVGHANEYYRDHFCY